MTWHNSHLVPAQRCIFVWIDEMMLTQCVIPENIYNSPTEGEIQIKLYTFLKNFWPWRSVHPPGNFNPFCGSSMFFFWNCTIHNSCMTYWELRQREINILTDAIFRSWSPVWHLVTKEALRLLKSKSTGLHALKDLFQLGQGCCPISDQLLWSSWELIGFQMFEYSSVHVHIGLEWIILKE